MRTLRVASLVLVVLGWGLGGVAQAGNVTRTATEVTYQAVLPAAAEDVTVGVEGASLFVASVRGATTTDCTQTDAARADCNPAPTAVVNLLDTADVVRADALPAAIALVAHGGGGDDMVGGGAGSDRLSGDDGNDHLDGKGGADLLDGGTGEDTIVGGPGQDELHGGAGDDVIDSRDGAFDVVDCGAGNDSALTDPGDAISGCEAEEPAAGAPIVTAAPGPPAAGGGPPFVFSGPRRVRVSRSGRFVYAFRATPGATGRLGLQSRRTVAVGARKRKLNVGAKSFTAPAGGSVKLRFRLSAGSLRALRRASRLAFRVRVVIGDATLTTQVTLLAPKRQKR